MTDLNKLLTPLFLSEKEIRKIIELIFFSYREFTLGPDEILNKINYGRAHHRVIYFVGKQKKYHDKGPSWNFKNYKAKSFKSIKSTSKRKIYSCFNWRR